MWQQYEIVVIKLILNAREDTLTSLHNIVTSVLLTISLAVVLFPDICLLL